MLGWPSLLAQGLLGDDAIHVEDAKYEVECKPKWMHVKIKNGIFFAILTTLLSHLDLLLEKLLPFNI